MAATTVVIDGTVLTPRREFEEGAVLLDGGEVAAVGPADDVDVPADARVVSAAGGYIAPGFVDMHVNGGGGGDVLDGTREAVDTMARAHLESGTTALAPTVITAPRDTTLAAVEAIGSARRGDTGGADVLGAFLEGPYLATEQRGAHNPDYLREPDPEEYEAFLEHGEDIAMMAAAPELPGALELGRRLDDAGVLPAIAHSDATFEEVLAAVEAGYSHVVHLYSSLSRLKRRIEAGDKAAGVTEATLLLDELSTELIADGHHVPASMLALTRKAKGVDSLCTVTDAIAPAGLGPGEYELGGEPIVVEGGVAKKADRSVFAGSVATMDRCVRNMVEMGGLTVREAVATATLNPARVLGVEDRKGVLVPGADADLVVFDQSIEVQAAFVGGELRYEA
jgi:N-acetylglucosamine-6-phosphate deacetylase